MDRPSLKTVLAEALGLPPEQQEPFVRTRLETPDAETVLLLLKARAHEDTRLGTLLALPVAAQTGATIGAYTVIKSLGGGQSSVFLAQRSDGQFQRQVVIKFLGTLTAGSEKLMQQEQQVLAALDHPNIARLLEVGVWQGDPYLVMEFFDGQPITSYCRDHAGSIASKLALFSTACDTVSYSHRRLIVHRDLKPSHILVAGSGELKLIDFGISKILNPAAPVTATQGQSFTPQYASPEQVSGRPVGTATDIYSLGVVLYELLTGRLPYAADGGNTPHLLQCIATTDPVPAPELDADLFAIVSRAMRKEPDARYRTVDELRGDLRNYLEGYPVAARQGSLHYATSKYIRRHRWSLTAGALALALVLGASAMALRQAQRAERRTAELKEMADGVLWGLESRLYGKPGSLGTVDTIHQERIKFLQRLQQDDPTEDVDRKLIRAFADRGARLSDPDESSTGDTRNAGVNYDKAFELAQVVSAVSWPRRDGQALEDRAELARVVSGRARVAWERGHEAQAERLFAETLALTSDFDGREPQNESQAQLGELHIKNAGYHALLLAQVGRRAAAAGLAAQSVEAAHSYWQAAVLAEQRRKPGEPVGLRAKWAEPRRRRMLSQALQLSATTSIFLADYAGARPCVEEAIRIERALLAGSSSNVTTQRMLARHLMLRAQVLRHGGQAQEALHAATEAEQLMRAAVAADQASRRYARDLAQALEQKALTLAQLGRRPETIRLLREQLALLEEGALIDTESARVRQELATCQRNLQLFALRP